MTWMKACVALVAQNMIYEAILSWLQHPLARAISIVQERLRKLVIGMVLGTDMKMHLSLVSAFRSRVEVHALDQMSARNSRQPSRGPSIDLCMLPNILPSYLKLHMHIHSVQNHIPASPVQGLIQKEALWPHRPSAAFLINCFNETSSAQAGP